MSVTLYKYRGDNNVVNKSLGSPLFTADGAFIDDIDVLNPTFTLGHLEGVTEETLQDCNYMYISEFGRYYYITGMTIPYDSELTIRGKVDVLKTYSADIMGLGAIVERNSMNYNNYLIDHSAQAYNFPMVLTKRFPGSFGSLNYYLTVAGSPQTD